MNSDCFSCSPEMCSLFGVLLIAFFFRLVLRLQLFCLIMVLEGLWFVLFRMFQPNLSDAMNVSQFSSGDWKLYISIQNVTSSKVSSLSLSCWHLSAEVWCMNLLPLLNNVGYIFRICWLFSWKAEVCSNRNQRHWWSNTSCAAKHRGKWLHIRCFDSHDSSLQIITEPNCWLWFGEPAQPETGTEQ